MNEDIKLVNVVPPEDAAFHLRTGRWQVLREGQRRLAHARTREDLIDARGLIAWAEAELRRLGAIPPTKTRTTTEEETENG